MRIALIQLPHFYGHEMSRAPENYPLGLGYVSAYLLRHDVAQDGIDLWGRGLSVAEALDTVPFGDYDVLGISAYATQYRYLLELTRGIKERWPDVHVTSGGPGPTFSAETILRHTGVDTCVIGEGEVTALELFERLDARDSVDGIAFLRDGDVVRTSPRAYVRDLDSLPLPNRELFDFEAYVTTANKVRAESDHPELRDHPRRTGDIIAGRGCPYTCTFCSKTFSGCRLRGIDAIVDEIRLLQERWGIDHLQFNDELVVTSKRRILALCERLAGMGVTWSCQGRVDQVDREILEAMKAAGCVDIGYGVESASQSILDAMDKRISAGDIVPVIKMTREIGIHPVVQYMYGYPGENDETIRETERFFDAIDHPYVGFTTTPIPGSPLYETVKAKGILGAEHDYLLRLDSGYNLAGGMVNLTGFSDAEFLAKKRTLHHRVMHNYLKRRPVEYVRYVLAVAKRRLGRLLHS